MSDLSQLLASAQRTAVGLQFDVSDNWLQGRSLFGGIQAALAVEAMAALSEGLPLRTVQATLFAPVPAGPVQIHTREIRRGKNTVHAEARFVDGEQTLALFIGVFGRGRESVVRHQPSTPELPAGPGLEFRYVPGIFPAFLQHFEVTCLKGGPPFSGSGDHRQIFRVKLKDSASQTGLAHVLSLADYPPPVASSHLRQPTPGSTLTWMIDLCSEDFSAEPLEGWIIDVQLLAADAGYTQQSVALYAPSGGLVALGRQCMVVFG